MTNITKLAVTPKQVETFENSLTGLKFLSSTALGAGTGAAVGAVASKKGKRSEGTLKGIALGAGVGATYGLHSALKAQKLVETLNREEAAGKFTNKGWIVKELKKKAEIIMDKLADCAQDPAGPLDPLQKLVKVKAKDIVEKTKAVKDIHDKG